MLNSDEVLHQMILLISELMEIGLSTDQNFPFKRKIAEKITEIAFPNSELVSLSIKEQPYQETYELLDSNRIYLMKMPDGGLIQMMYLFINEEISKHRLCYFPSPSLLDYQNNPDLYDDDVFFSDIVSKKTVTFPIRFDYSIEEINNHPKSHLTLGDYKNCRIPITSALSPFLFIDFVLRNFYNTSFNYFSEKISKLPGAFTKSIREEEKRIIHINLPE